MKLINLFQTLSFLLILAVIGIFLVPLAIGIKPFIVLSGSMEPNIQTGSITYVNTHVNVEEIKAGDIIGFQMGENQVTHRVVSVNEDKSFTTKGDANDNVDEGVVKFEEYIGKTVFSIPQVGKLIALLKTKKGYFSLFVFIGFNFLFILFEEESKKPKEKINEKKAC